MHLAWVDWLIITVLILGALYLGWGRQTKVEWVDYFLARNKMSTRFTLSNYFGANLAFTSIFLVLSLEGARRGWVVLVVPASWLLGTGLLTLIYPKLVPFFEKGETLHQALGRIYDKGNSGNWGVQRWASLWTITAFVGTVALEFYGGVLLFEWAGVPQLTRYALATILASVCTIFTVRGGLRGIGKVNFWLDAFSIAGILILIVFIIKAILSPAPHTQLATTAVTQLPSTTDNISFAIGSFLLFFPFQICALDTWQRGVAWQKRRYVAGPLLIGGLGIAGASVVAIWCGQYLTNHGLYNKDEIPLLTLLSALHIPRFWIGIVVAGFIAAILSTADELLNCCGYAVLADFYKLPRKVDSIETHQKYIRSGKFYIGIFALLSALIAWLILVRDQSILAFFTAIIATQVVFTFPIFFGLFSKQKEKLGGYAKWAMILSFAVAIVLSGYGLYLLLQKQEGQPIIDVAPLLAAATAFLVMLVGRIFVRKK